MIKKLAIAVGVIVGVAHIGALGHLMNRQSNLERSVPVQVPLPPVGEYTSFTITSTPEGYTIEYIGNDPRVLTQETETTRSGFLGGRRETRVTTEYTQDGARNQGTVDEGKLSAAEVACIEAAGRGRSSGALVGTSVAASAIPFVSGIPYVGWLAAGWVTLFGGQIGGDIGAEVATIVRDC